MSIADVSPRVGKRVGFYTYLHRDAVELLSEEQRTKVWDAETLSGHSAWNVVKLRDAPGGKLSLLTYEDFSEAFPALLESFTIDLDRRLVVRRGYRERANPPILHRKELLLPPGDPELDRYAALTANLEQRGLFLDARTIGTREAWRARLEAAGLRIVEHEVLEGEQPQASVTVQRHRAALRRDGLSTPVQALLRHELITPEVRVFDYGCGRGSDVEGLHAMGIAAAGWDPYFSPEETRREAEVVNLGFVLNVIEDKAERVAALREAFGLAKICLAVAVIVTSSRSAVGRPYNDGVLTRLGTFQKFYEASELKSLLEAVLGREAFQVGPGLFFVFKDQDAEQDFLLKRQDSRRPSIEVLTVRRERRRRDKIEALAEELHELGALILRAGRHLLPDEISTDLLARFKEKEVSASQALKWAVETVPSDLLQDVGRQRRDDLSVYFALNIFNRRQAYRSLPLGLQRDVRGHFGDYATAQEQARRLLFSLGRPDTLVEAAHSAWRNGVGQFEDGNYWVCAGLKARLPAVLRCFSGCAERYFGGLDGMHMLKFHVETGKLTALRYPDFETSPLPRLAERVKIDLKGQRILEFDHYEQDQRLILKSRFMAPDQPGYDRQIKFDQEARRAGLGALGVRASAVEIDDLLGQAGRSISGWAWS
ncbi:DNA phosphorothioation-associated putative methyltransferase [Brevundimonas bullata]